MDNSNNQKELIRVVRDQRQITACAVEIINAVKKKRGKPLQPRDRMALKLLTPKNSALLVRGKEKNLGCRQVTFDIITDDIGRGVHRLTPTGVHVLNPAKGWWSDNYGMGQFLWNLLLKEEVSAGMARILERLFKFKLKGILGDKANLSVSQKHRRIAGNIDKNLKLYIQRDEGQVETTLRRLIKAEALYSPKEIGLTFDKPGPGRVVLLFGKNKRYGVSFAIEKL